MNALEERQNLNRYARLGGFMYLFVIGVYVAGDVLAGSFQVSGNFAQTATNIQESEAIFRAGLALQLVASITTVLLGGAFYVLLRPVDRHLALFALLWRVLEAAIGGVTVILKFLVLGIHLGRAEPIDIGSQEALARLVVGGGGASFVISITYFAVGSILFFYLLYRSRFIPRWLAGLGLGASVVAALLAFATLIAPREAAAVQFLWGPIFIAEILTGLMLMIRGANFRWWDQQVAAGEAQASLPSRLPLSEKE